MSMHKAIASGQEHRQPYRKSKAFDYSCHNHGACGYCEDNRTYFARKARSIVDQKMNEFLQGKE